MAAWSATANMADSLIEAAKRGDVQRVTTLMGFGADVNGADKYGSTPLHIGAQKGDVAVVKALLGRGADVNRANKYGDTALNVAAWNGHGAVMETLLARKANVNSRNKHGSTALIWAAEYGHVAIVEALLERGADVHRATEKGRTALHYAAQEGNVAIVEALLARGATVNTRDKHGNTELTYAAKKGHVAVVKALLARGANVNSTNKYSSTALNLAASNEHVAVVEALLAHGANVLSADRHGRTALHCATYKGHVAIMEALLAHGADVFPKRPRLLAAGGNQQSVQSALWRARAHLLKQDEIGNSPLLLLPQRSDAAQLIRTVSSPQFRQSAPSTSPPASYPQHEPPPPTELQQLWLDAKTSTMTPPQLLGALKAEHITSFSDFVLAHYLLLLAVRQRVLTRAQLAAFGGSRDYLLENVYLPVTKFSLSNGQKLWLSRLLSYAEKKKIIREGNAALVKIVADLRSEIRQTRLEMHSAVVSVARDINSLRHRVESLESWTNEAAKGFQRLCQGKQQILSDMKNMAACLQQLHSWLQQQNRNHKIAGLLAFCLAMVPMIGDDLVRTTSATEETALGLTLERFSSVGTVVVKEILARDISNYQTASLLISEEYLSHLDPDARERVEVVVEQTDFKTISNLQQSLTVVIEELKDSEVSQESEEDEGEEELRQRFAVLASRSPSGEQTVTAQDAIPELHHMIQHRLNHRGADVTVDGGDAEDIVMEQMNRSTGLLDMEGFVKSFHELCEKYPFATRQPEPPELRERFQNASRSKKLLKIRIAKLMLRALFDAS